MSFAAKSLRLVENKGFRPTASMRLYAYHVAKHPKDSQAKNCRALGFHPSTISHWKTFDGFDSWFEDAVREYQAPIHELLEETAVKNRDDFRFWEALADKYGYYRKHEQQEKQASEAVSVQMTAELELEMLKKLRETREEKQNAGINGTGVEPITGANGGDSTVDSGAVPQGQLTESAV